MVSKFVETNAHNLNNKIESAEDQNNSANVQQEKIENSQEKFIGKKRQNKKETNNQNSEVTVKREYDNINLLDIDAKIHRAENVENLKNVSSQKNSKENSDSKKNRSIPIPENVDDEPNLNKNIINFINDKSVSDELSSDESSNLI